MSKNFDAWNNRKKQLDTRHDAPRFNEREIWWCSLGHNIGYEQDGTGKNFDRPVLIVRRFGAGMFWGAALTTQPPNLNKPSARFYQQVTYQGLAPDKDSYVILSQLRVLSNKRLIMREGRLSKNQFQKVVDQLKGLLP